MKLKLGDTVTDGWKTYVLGTDGYMHYISHGNHAKYHVTEEELSKTIKSYGTRSLR